MDNFYMHLPSNSSMEKYFPANKTSSYTVKLPQMMYFTNGNWEVGLAEIMFPNSWHNIHHPFNYIEYTWETDNDTGEFWLRHELIPGWYSIDQLLSIINYDVFKAQFHKKSEIQAPKYNFKYDTNLKRISLHGNKANTCALYFNDTLGRMLGYGGGYVCKLNTFGEKKQIAPKMCDMYLTTPKYLYIYTDIIENQIVGGGKYQLLRSVNVGKSAREDYQGGIISRTYDRIFYIPLKSKEFDTIEVNIRQEGGGELAPFGSGIATLILHFRKTYDVQQRILSSSE